MASGVDAPPVQKSPLRRPSAAAGLQELHRAADIPLRGCIAEVQSRHEVMRFFGLDRGLAAVEVRGTSAT